MEPRELLRKMARTYEDLATYSDSGVVTTTLRQAGETQVLRRPFATAFARPQRFRFEFTDEALGQRYLIWQLTPPARLQHGDEVETRELPMAIAALTGVSGGSALSVPRLLMPALIPSRALTDLEDPVLEGEETVEGARCWRVRGHQLTATQTLFIGQDLLVRRILEVHHFDRSELESLMAAIPEDLRDPLPPELEQFDTEQEALYRPRRDPPLTEADFRGP